MSNISYEVENKRHLILHRLLDMYLCCIPPPYDVSKDSYHLFNSSLQRNIKFTNHREQQIQRRMRHLYVTPMSESQHFGEIVFHKD